MEILKPNNSDFNKIGEILKTGLSKPPYSEDWSKENAIKKLNYLSKIGEIYIAVEEKKILGFVAFKIEPHSSGNIGVIEYLFTDCNVIGKGIGSNLLNHIEEICKNQNIKEIYLSSQKNALAYNFYIKKGFIPNNNSIYMKKEL